MTSKTTTAPTDVAEAFAPRSDAHLPALAGEIVQEIESSTPSTISVLAATDVQKAVAALAELQAGSIKLTIVEDWVIFTAKDGAQLGYLQDAGCQRVRSLWGINFSDLDPRRDLLEETLPDGHLVVDAYVTATCNVTGERIQEIGHRSSIGLFESAWKKAVENDDHAGRARLRADIRKSAIANAQGRIVRRATGLSQVPVHRLCQVLGVKPERLRGIRFESGTRGGGGGGMNDATDGQIRMIAGQATKERKVNGIGAFNDAEALVRGANLTKAQATKVIDALKAAQQPLSRGQFEHLLGIVAPEPGSEG